MEERKLYVKSKCSVCRGKKIGCFYCDSDGMVFIEASDKLLTEWFKSLSNERKDEIKKMWSDDK